MFVFALVVLVLVVELAVERAPAFVAAATDTETVRAGAHKELAQTQENLNRIVDEAQKQALGPHPSGETQAKTQAQTQAQQTHHCLVIAPSP